MTDIVINISSNPEATTVAELRRRFPDVAIRDMPPNQALEYFDAARMFVDPQPDISQLQVAELGPPKVRDGRWVREWTVRDKTPDERAAEVEAEVSKVAEQGELIDRAMVRAMAKLAVFLRDGGIPAQWTEEQIEDRILTFIRDEVRRLKFGA